MDLRVSYLGMHLANPIVVGPCPIADDLDLVRRAEDAGAAALVMHSLYEEQLTVEALATHRDTATHADAFPEAQSFLPEVPRFALGPDDYLEQLARIKRAVAMPVIGSLNGITDRGWLEYARLMEQAGADALELNVYRLPTDPAVSGAEVEAELLRMVRHVAGAITIPFAVKLTPFYSALPHLARALVAAGARGLVLFNRLFEPDLDPDELALVPRLHLSSPAELGLRLRWLAVLADRVEASLAVTGGVHDALGAIKAVMAGAHAVQMVSAILERGPEHIGRVVQEMGRWLEEHEYASIAEMRGSMSVDRCPDPGCYERVHYLRILQSWRAPAPRALPVVPRGDGSR